MQAGTNASAERTARIKIRPVDTASSADLGFLYGALILRLKEPDCNISHHKMPTWDRHCAYIRSGIYVKHYIAELANRSAAPVGHCYVDQLSNVGIWVSPMYRSRGFASQMLKHLIDSHPTPLYANINPKNTASRLFFHGAGFKVYDMDDVQLTLKLKPPGRILSYIRSKLLAFRERRAVWSNPSL